MAKSFFKKIVVAINGKQSSIQTAMYAVMMAKIYNIEIRFVFVIDTATIKFLSINKLIISDDLEERLEADGKRYLEYVEMLASSKGVKCQKDLRKGGVFSEVLKSAEEFEADLILLGGNIREVGKTGIKHNFLSSAETSILSNSKCPVMIVQKPNIEAEFKIF
ncbi:MAG: universal stress protein [Treponema sp.]|nr:universal stress protein [Treponema sp.]